MDVAVVVRRPFEDLAVLVPVPARDLDEPRRLEDEVALLALRDEAIRRAARDDDVVAVLVRHVAEGGLERSRALVDEDDLVALAVTEEVVHRRVRAAQRDLDVRVPHERSAPADLVAARIDVIGVHPPVRVRLGNPLLALDRREGPELLDAARRLEVVEDRLVPREALEPHDLLGQEPAVLAEDDVSLARDVPAALVEGHARPFRVGVTWVLADGRWRGATPRRRPALSNYRRARSDRSARDRTRCLPSPGRRRTSPWSGTGRASPERATQLADARVRALMSSTSK